MNRLTLALLAWLLLPTAGVTQEPIVTGVRTWSSGEPGPLPVRVQFFSSRPDNGLDSAAVHSAVWQAMLALHLPPDLKVDWRSPSRLNRLHLHLEVNVYSAGEVRFEHVLIGPDGVPKRACRGEAQWGGTSPIHLSHRVRDVLECAMRRYDIEWR